MAGRVPGRRGGERAPGLACDTTRGAPQVRVYSDEKQIKFSTCLFISMSQILHGAYTHTHYIYIFVSFVSLKFALAWPPVLYAMSPSHSLNHACDPSSGGPCSPCVTVVTATESTGMGTGRPPGSSSPGSR